MQDRENRDGVDRMTAGFDLENVEPQMRSTDKSDARERLPDDPLEFCLRSLSGHCTDRQSVAVDHFTSTVVRNNPILVSDQEATHHFAGDAEFGILFEFREPTLGLVQGPIGN